jgi:hypothetical protein
MNTVYVYKTLLIILYSSLFLLLHVSVLMNHHQAIYNITETTESTKDPLFFRSD